MADSLSSSPTSYNVQITTHRQRVATVVVLLYMNIINYMDRYALSGILPDIKTAFHLTDSQSGLLQTSFIFSFIIIAPIVGYLGDRYSRKYLMTAGMVIWSLMTFATSMMYNFYLFFTCRCLVGIGEASYFTLAPAIISDMFVKEKRSMFLALFFLAIPVGSGIGIVIGSQVTRIAGETLPKIDEPWRWSLRLSPILGIIAVFLILYVNIEPIRGESDGAHNLRQSSFLSDLKYLSTNKSYILTVGGSICLTFVAGALAWWSPIFIEYGVLIQQHPNIRIADVPLIFGALSMAAGLIGIPLGSLIAQNLRKKWSSADPLVCCVALLISLPLNEVFIYLAEFNALITLILNFLARIFTSLNWAIISDIKLYVVIPTRRATAAALSLSLKHALGDAGSPYVIGIIADTFQTHINVPNNTKTSFTDHEPRFDYCNVSTSTTEIVNNWHDNYVNFKSLQYSLYISCAVTLISAMFFLLASCFVTKDKEKCNKTMSGVF